MFCFLFCLLSDEPLQYFNAFFHWEKKLLISLH